MALTPLRLFIDIDGKTLVSSENSSNAFELPPFYQGDTVALEIMLLKRTASYNGGYGVGAIFERVVPTGLGLRVGIGTPNPATATTPPFYQNSFTANASDGIFTGTLEIGASAASTALNGQTSVALTLEVEVEEGGAYTTAIQIGCTLKAEVIEAGATSPPTPAESYPTRSEADSRYVRFIMGNGQTITIPDSTGTYAVVIGCNTDGSVKMDTITL